MAVRAGMRKAKVALVRKLAVVLHRILADGTAFDPPRDHQEGRTVRPRLSG